MSKHRALSWPASGLLTRASDRSAVHPSRLTKGVWALRTRNSITIPAHSTFDYKPLISLHIPANSHLTITPSPSLRRLDLLVQTYVFAEADPYLADPVITIINSTTKDRVVDGELVRLTVSGQYLEQPAVMKDHTYDSTRRTTTTTGTDTSTQTDPVQYRCEYCSLLDPLPTLPLEDVAHILRVHDLCAELGKTACGKIIKIQ